MRKASMNFKSGALYTKDGRKLADIDSGIVEWGVQVTAEVPTKSVATVTRNTTGTTIRNSTWADRIRERFMRVV